MHGTCQELLKPQHKSSEGRQEGEEVLPLDTVRARQAYAALALVLLNCSYLHQACVHCPIVLNVMQKHQMIALLTDMQLYLLLWQVLHVLGCSVDCSVDAG